MSKLSTADRKALPASDFVFPETREYPIPDETHGRNALARGAQNESGERLAKIRRAVHAKFPNIDSVEKSSSIIVDKSQQLVYGVVLSPGVEDSQGDIVSPEDIEKAAHNWLTEYRQHDVQHSEQPAPIEPVESYIAPSDMVIGGKNVLKGAWVLVAKVHDPETWERVTKEDHPNPLTGWSIGGSGVREPIAA